MFGATRGGSFWNDTLEAGEVMEDWDVRLDVVEEDGEAEFFRALDGRLMDRVIMYWWDWYFVVDEVDGKYVVCGGALLK